MSQAEWNNNQPDDPGAGGLAEGAPEERFAKARVHFNGSTLSLVASFIAAIAVLYLLGLQNQPRKATATELERGKLIDENLKIALSMTNDPQYEQKMAAAGGLARALMSLGNGQDGDVEPTLPRNPFEHDVPAAVTHIVDDGSHIAPPPLPPAVDPNVRLAQQEFMGLRLQIVMMGAHPSALVNNKVVEPGTKFEFGPDDTLFLTVNDIVPGKVQLQFTDKDGKNWPFDLKSEPQQKKN